jgi:hypothetical protein
LAVFYLFIRRLGRAAEPGFKVVWQVHAGSVGVVAASYIRHLTDVSR